MRTITARICERLIKDNKDAKSANALTLRDYQQIVLDPAAMKLIETMVAETLAPIPDWLGPEPAPLSRWGRLKLSLIDALARIAEAWAVLVGHKIATDDF